MTLHEGELDLVDEFDKPFHGDTRLGDLTGPSFLSLVLDWQISGYFGVIERLQAEIDRLDEELLTQSPDEEDLLERLQALRTRVRKLRSTLSSHRDVLGLLSHPRSDVVIGAEAVEDYKRLEERLQQAIDTVDTAREMIVGSFDIFMTRTAQATNDIMKRLTIVSVLLLPSVVLAGIMGMNFKVGVFEQPVDVLGDDHNHVGARWRDSAHCQTPTMDLRPGLDDSRTMFREGGFGGGLRNCQMTSRLLLKLPDKPRWNRRGEGNDGIPLAPHPQKPGGFVVWNGVRRTWDALHSYSGTHFPNFHSAKTKARNLVVPDSDLKRGVGVISTS